MKRARTSDPPEGQSGIVVGLNAVVVAVTGETPRILTVRRTGHFLGASEESLAEHRGEEPQDALPYGPLDVERDRTLELGLRRWVRELTGSELGYVEQLYTFGNRFRDPLERVGGPRVLTVAYLALVREGALRGTGGAAWRDWYGYLPWEDWRHGRPTLIERTIAPSVDGWVRSAESKGDSRARRERADIAFGLRGASWNEERVIDRYEILYEVGLVEEAGRDRGEPRVPARGVRGAPHDLPGRSMTLDHRRLLASALGRVRGKIKYRPVVFELLPERFTLLQLQRTVEAMAGVRLHKQNFRRLVEHGGLVERTEAVERHTGGRPAAMFRFRREVLRERPAPGVGLPGWQGG